MQNSTLGNGIQKPPCICCDFHAFPAKIANNAMWETNSHSYIIKTLSFSRGNFIIYNNSPVVRPRWLGLSIDQNHFKSPLRRKQLLCYETIALGTGVSICVYIYRWHILANNLFQHSMCVCVGQGPRNHYLTECPSRWAHSTVNKLVPQMVIL